MLVQNLKLLADACMKKRRLKMVHQSEARECGLACLCMMANWLGIEVEMPQLRQQAGAISRGLTLKHLISRADSIGLRGIPLKGEPEAVASRGKPCILHWNFDHFVVFHRYYRNTFEVYDPAVGILQLSRDEFSKSFTGVFVEFESNGKLFNADHKSPPKLINYLKQTNGIFKSLTTIFFVAAVLEVCNLFAPLYLRFVIDHITSVQHFDLLSVVTVGFVILGLVTAVLNLLRSVLIVLLTQHLALQWPVNIFSHMMRLPMEFFYRHTVGDLTSRFGSLGAIQQKLTVGATEAFLDGLMAIVSIFVLLAYSPTLALIPFAALSLQIFIRYLAFDKTERLSRDRLVASSREHTYFLESIRAILPLKLFSREMERQVGWQSLMTNVQQLDIRKGHLESTVASLIAVIASLENIAVVYFGIRLVFFTAGGDPFTLGMLIVFFTYKIQFLTRANGILKFMFEFKMIRIHTERLAEIIMVAPEPVSPTQDLSDLQSTIELRNLSFKYESDGELILNNVSCTFLAGERVAITGQSGEGKTTLLKVILGLLTPTEGAIYFGGLSLTEIGKNNIRPLIGTVMQEDALLVGSVRQNIAFFSQDATDEEIQKCARMAGIHDEILRMPMGYLSKVGDLGDGLSGGQKQRLLLARALFKRPKFLLLDEATSHLDIFNESLVNQSISSLNITRIVVAHRPSTIAGSDRVFRLSRGRLELIDKPTLISAPYQDKTEHVS